MRTAIIIGLLLIVAYFIFVPALARSGWRAVAVNAKATLHSTYVAVQKGGVYTNDWTVRFHVRPYTNRYVIGGEVYQCVMAVDSWDYQGRSNLLAITIEERFLYIDQRGAVPVSHLPPGY
ncbi:MAG TPA: hypothetical protein P5186_15770 [Candidatus Paceibacterota bacterium]|nr:hypothetical protein [Candidatus Paceibacterota bacterium]